MKKILITLAVLLVFAGVAVVTCPDRDAHKDAIMAVVNDKISDELTAGGDKEAEGIALFASSLGSGIANYVIDNRLTVRNHFVYSTGEIKNFNGENERVSVGVFGHVFTFSKEDLDKALKQ